jgi:hypothetical protein
VEAALERAVASWQAIWPGLALNRATDGLRFEIPPALRHSHEEHFALVLDEFLDTLERGAWPEAQASDIVCKYTLLGRAWELANQGDAA